MPPNGRQALSEIFANRQSRTELSPIQRAAIVGAAFSGIPVRKLAKVISTPESTIRLTLKNANSRPNLTSLPQSGQPKKYTNRDKRRLLRIVQLHPKWTWQRVRKEMGLNISLSTYKRILKEYGITNWRSKRRPFLSPDHAKARLVFATKFLGYSDNEWAQIIWSDECLVEQGKGKERTWSFCTPQQRYLPEMVETYRAGKGISIMVWAAFSGKGGRSQLYLMVRDPESKRGGYSANSYLALLNEMIPTLYKPDFIFMQDNAPIHTAHKVRDWFAENLITVLEWPPYSPDLNPIENLWRKLKEMLLQVRPDIEEVSGNPDTVREVMGEALQEAWDLIPQSYIDGCWQSMHRRMEAVIVADGWYTKY